MDVWLCRLQPDSPPVPLSSDEERGSEGVSQDQDVPTFLVYIAVPPRDLVENPEKKEFTAEIAPAPLTGPARLRSGGERRTETGGFLNTFPSAVGLFNRASRGRSSFVLSVRFFGVPPIFRKPVPTSVYAQRNAENGQNVLSLPPATLGRTLRQIRWGLTD
jgi:hypothetical protein